jgi:hypothetical protein
MGNERLRPPGFPLSEEELQRLKRLRMAEVIRGVHVSTHSEWILRGIPKEPFRPTVAIGIFPTPAATPRQYILEPEIYSPRDIQKPLIEYWREITALPFPDRVKGLERQNYRQLVEIGDQILEELSLGLARDLLPSSMIVFSKPDANKQESAYLICPTIFPPSAAYRQIQLQARQYLHSA